MPSVPKALSTIVRQHAEQCLSDPVVSGDYGIDKGAWLALLKGDLRQHEPAAYRALTNATLDPYLRAIIEECIRFSRRGTVRVDLDHLKDSRAIVQLPLPSDPTGPWQPKFVVAATVREHLLAGQLYMLRGASNISMGRWHLSIAEEAAKRGLAEDDPIAKLWAA